MLKAFRRLFAGKPQKRTTEFQDPVLGTLYDGDGWEATIVINGRALKLQIGGYVAPDPELIEHARDIFRGFPQFEKMVIKFLEAEAKRTPGAAGEIRQLIIECITLPWPQHPNDGMIYFKGPNEYRVWRCDYVGRKPQKLGFDD